MGDDQFAHLASLAGQKCAVGFLRLV